MVFTPCLPAVCVPPPLPPPGKVELSLLSRAQGIEAYMYEDKLEDADADEDGLINFEEFLGSYARWGGGGTSGGAGG